MSKQSKKAFQKLINQYIEVIYTLNLPEDLKQLIAKFDPKAKEAREEEEKAFKQAELEGKRKLTPGAPITVGVGESEYTPLPSSSRERPTRPTYQPFIPKAEPSRTFGPGLAEQKKPSQKAPTKGEVKLDKAKEGEKEVKDKKEDKFADLQKQAAVLDEKIFKEADTIVDKIADNLKNVAKSIKDTKLFANLEKHLTDESDVDLELATEIIPDLVRELSIRRGALGNIEQLHNKLKTSAARKKYKEKLKKFLEEHKSPIDMLLNQIAKIEKNWQNILGTIPVTKRYAYFGLKEEEESMPQIDIDKQLAQIEEESKSVEEGLEKAVELLETKEKPVDEKLVEIQQKVPTPISLHQLKKNILALKKAIDTFDQAKSKIK